MLLVFLTMYSSLYQLKFLNQMLCIFYGFVKSEKLGNCYTYISSKLPQVPLIIPPIIVRVLFESDDEKQAEMSDVEDPPVPSEMSDHSDVEDPSVESEERPTYEPFDPYNEFGDSTYPQNYF